MDVNALPRAGVDVSVIIVNWNSSEYVIGAIKSINECARNGYVEIIVVDNASANDDIGRVAEQFPSVVVLRNGENLGFSRANNLGARVAKGEWLVFLNPDTVLVSDAFSIMVEEVAGRADVGVLGARLLNGDGTVQLSAIRPFPTILNQVVISEALQLRWPNCPLWAIGPLFRESGAEPVDVISGACMMVKRSVFTALGGFCEDFFMYGEDVELCHRIARSGLRNYYVGRASVVHFGGKSSSQVECSEWSSQMMVESRHRYFVKTKGPVYGALFRGALGSAAAVRWLAVKTAWAIGKRHGRIRFAAQKWWFILRWCVGLGRRDVVRRATEARVGL